MSLASLSLFTRNSFLFPLNPSVNRENECECFSVRGSDGRTTERVEQSEEEKNVRDQDSTRLLLMMMRREKAENFCGFICSLI
jgi:hypothetical protein